MANGKKPKMAGQGIAPYGIRWSDQTTGQPPVEAKGLGYFGKIPTPSGAPMTEFSTAFDINGRLVQAPLVVPTLTPQEIQTLQSGTQIPEAVYQKAQQHAISRIQQGRYPFATRKDLRVPVGYKDGGMVENVYENPAQGGNMAQDRTTSLDLPPVLSQLLGPTTPPVTQSPVTQQNFNPAGAGLSSGMAQPQNTTFMPSYAQGGMVGAGGMPVGAGQAGVQPQQPQAPIPPQQIEMAVQEFMNQYPDRVAQIQQVIQAGMQQFGTSVQDFEMMEQMALTAMNNPELYPNIRQLAIQQGFATEQELPQTYDPAVIMSVLVAARIAKQMGQGGGMQVPAMGQATSPPANFAMGGMVDDKVVTPGEMAADGGKVVGPGTGTSDSIPIRVSTGEYVIPANVVRMKGKEFFDSMLEKYKDS